ncbi:hypothetical protein FQR65_LT17133 [Abscondita terminalis]|nr:hypothetical protein FQR65_LT17133 [Abscondita terminalis]
MNGRFRYFEESTLKQELLTTDTDHDVGDENESEERQYKEESIQNGLRFGYGTGCPARLTDVSISGAPKVKEWTVKGRRKTTSGQASKKINKWRFEDQMQFLKQYLHERETASNLTEGEPPGDEHREEEVDDEMTPVDSQAASLSSSSTGRKRKAVNSNLAEALTSFIQTRTPSQEEESPHSARKKKLMTFMDDICESMLKFPELDQAEIKNQIFNLVNKKEIEILKRRENQSHALLIRTPTPILHNVQDAPTTSYNYPVLPGAPQDAMYQQSSGYIP